MRGLVICIAMLSATPARADDREEARREFGAGQAADGDKDWQSAIEHYLRANQLLQHPFTTFNIAVDYERLGRTRESATWYERYIDQITDANERAKTQRLVDSMNQRPAKLKIESTPSGARILIDGNAAGHTPATVMAKGGMHHITVEADGQHDAKDITIEFGEPQEVSFAFKAPAGELAIAGTPPGAIISVDDLPAGTLPATLQVQPGPHHIHITSYGYQAWDSDFSVESNHTTNVSVTMTRALGTIDPPHTITLHYLVGAAGGADARGSGAAGWVELGVRYTQFALLVQLGKVADNTFVSFLGRYSVLPGSFSPYVGVGYVGVGTGGDTTTSGGFEIEGGLHYDILKSDKGALSAVLGAGVYYFSTTDPMTGDSSLTVAVPVSLALEGSFGK
ncbi:MAG TPA: PEGA domain-containing protein [Kofleriaceae bacterium]|nr:PEGA domain-containing protein [Kofleriaceae bacterium]